MRRVTGAPGASAASPSGYPTSRGMEWVSISDVPSTPPPPLSQRKTTTSAPRAAGRLPGTRARIGLDQFTQAIRSLADNGHKITAATPAIVKQLLSVKQFHYMTEKSLVGAEAWVNTLRGAALVLASHAITTRSDMSDFLLIVLFGAFIQSLHVTHGIIRAAVPPPLTGVVPPSLPWEESGTSLEAKFRNSIHAHAVLDAHKTCIRRCTLHTSIRNMLFLTDSLFCAMESLSSSMYIEDIFIVTGDHGKYPHKDVDLLRSIRIPRIFFVTSRSDIPPRGFRGRAILHMWSEGDTPPASLLPLSEKDTWHACVVSQRVSAKKNLVQQLIQLVSRDTRMWPGWVEETRERKEDDELLNVEPLEKTSRYGLRPIPQVDVGSWLTYFPRVHESQKLTYLVLHVDHEGYDWAEVSAELMRHKVKHVVPIGARSNDASTAKRLRRLANVSETYALPSDPVTTRFRMDNESRNPYVRIVREEGGACAVSDRPYSSGEYAFVIHDALSLEDLRDDDLMSSKILRQDLISDSILSDLSVDRPDPVVLLVMNAASARGSKLGGLPKESWTRLVHNWVVGAIIQEMATRGEKRHFAFRNALRALQYHGDFDIDEGARMDFAARVHAGHFHSTFHD